MPTRLKSFPSTPLGALLLLACLHRPLAFPQRAPLPAGSLSDTSLQNILDRLEENLYEYRHSVPDLFCSEHVVSSIEDRRSRTATVTDSIFRLRRLPGGAESVTFEESRSIRAVDGKAPISNSEAISGPAVLSGVFSDGLQVVSRERRGCYEYTLRPPRQGHPKDKLVIEFKDLTKDERAVECPPFEGTRGQATIDPVTMHVLHLEKTTPDPSHPLGRTATWRWTVDYAPVHLVDKTFWMPQTIRSTSRTDDGMFLWEFNGTYKGYHLFHAESLIVPTTP